MARPIHALHLRRRQLDRLLTEPQALGSVAAPPEGWIAQTRKVLGMTAAQLARRMGVSQPTVAKLEASEANGGITLRSLRKAAEAMHCDVVVAFVPRRSFESIVEDQARIRARELVGQIEHTMGLEGQARPEELVREHESDIARNLASTLSRELWSSDPAP